MTLDTLAGCAILYAVAACVVGISVCPTDHPRPGDRVACAVFWPFVVGAAALLVVPCAVASILNYLGDE